MDGGGRPPKLNARISPVNRLGRSISPPVLEANNAFANPSTGAWNGFGYSVFGGTDFANNTFSAQLTIVIHEMMHVAWSGTPFGTSQNGVEAFIDIDKGGKVSAAWISTNCGTANPTYLPWQNEPTTNSPIPSTLQ